jgi:hypothetical protein
MITVHRMSSATELNVFLQGGILGSTLPTEANQLIDGLIGKTLVFSKPSVKTVTFAAMPDPDDERQLYLLEALAQIRTAFAGAVNAVSYQGRLLIVEAVPAQTVVLGGTGTANAMLGLHASGLTGRLYAAPGGAAPALISVRPSLTISGELTVFTEET